jgi:hypothetical protein
MMAFLMFCFVSAAAAETTVRFKPWELKWVPNRSIPPGVEMSVIYGDPSKTGPFIIRVRFPANYRLPPHIHPDTRNVTVLSGTYFAAEGEQFDRDKLIAFPPGGFYTNPAGVPHYAMTGPSETMIQEGGTGPSAIHYINAADDPRR